MTMLAYKAEYTNWNNEKVREFFATKMYARMFKESMEARGYRVSVELASVDAKDVRDTFVWA